MLSQIPVHPTSRAVEFREAIVKNAPWGLSATATDAAVQVQTAIHYRRRRIAAM